MCVNVRCSHKRGEGVRWQGVAWSVENKRKPLSQGNGHSCFIHSFIHSLVVSFAPFSPACVCVCVLLCVWASGSGRVRLHGCGLRLSQWIRPGRVALPLNMLVTSTLKHKLRFTVAKRAKSNGKPLPPHPLHSLHRPSTYYAHLLGLD